MAVLIDTRTGPVVQTDGAADQPLRQGRMGSLIVTDGHGKYFEQASRRNIYRAHAIVTSMAAYTTAAGIGGPLLWNGSSTVNAVILGVGFGVSTAFTTTSAAVGLTGMSGSQTSAPSSTTAIDSSGNCYIGGPAPLCSVYRIGTVLSPGTAFFAPFGHFHTGAVTVDTGLMQWFDVGGLFVVPPNAWISLATSVTTSSGVVNVGLTWEEVPIGN